MLWPQTNIAGAVSGIVNTPITAPVKQLRILSQSSSKPLSLVETVKKIHKDGGVQGLFRGISITLLRGSQAYGVYFLTYESLIVYIQKTREYRQKQDITTPDLL